MAKEADGWDPRQVAGKSQKKLKWRCEKGHAWDSTVSNRTPPHSRGCPYCAGKAVLKGFNDLATLFPGVASQADGWDPSKVSAGSSKKQQWRCDKEHFWEAPPKERTPPRSDGCPYCSGRRVLSGFNDLATLFPEVAKQAFGWDPTQIAGRAGKKLNWKCESGHVWTAIVQSRTPPKNNGCPFCAGQRVLKGINDLATLYPEVAKQADGWDPSSVAAKSSSKKLRWKCAMGHKWTALASTRTSAGAGCPYCAGKLVRPGVNDLATLFPDVAQQADGWDPKFVLPFTNKKYSWKCEKEHTWLATPNARLPPHNTGCPICSNKKVLVGFNDLATLCPEVAKEADGWDPNTVTPGSSANLQWRCQKGHTWKAKVVYRTGPNGTNCPTCASSGFKPGQPAWLYLFERPGEQQVGVTNEPEVRLKRHERNGWVEVEVVGPFPGDQVLDLEKKLKKWLRREVGLVPGTHENWFTARLEVNSLAELKAVSGVETDLF